MRLIQLVLLIYLPVAVLMALVDDEAPGGWAAVVLVLIGALAASIVLAAEDLRADFQRRDREVEQRRREERGHGQRR